eukprot:7145180-Prymnesium_polylepis.1
MATQNCPCEAGTSTNNRNGSVPFRQAQAPSHGACSILNPAVGEEKLAPVNPQMPQKAHTTDVNGGRALRDAEKHRLRGER